MKNNKFLKKFNIIDGVLVLVFALAAVLGIYKSFFLKAPETEAVPVFKAGGEIIEPEKTATVRYRIKNIRDISLKKLYDGVDCYYENGDKAGTIKNLSTENYYEYGLNNQNEYVKYEYEDRFNVYFDLELPGRLTRSAFNGIDWRPVGAGTVHYYTVDGISFECTVINVEPQE